jgi:uncharacterized protein YqgV (UPF0045/DUF77 family)
MISTIQLTIVPVAEKPLPEGAVPRWVGNVRRQFESAGLETDVHGLGMSVQGEHQEVFQALANVLSSVHDSGVTRIWTSVVIESRSDQPLSLQQKTAVVGASR